MKKYKHFGGIALLILVGFLVYANSLGNHFQFDDYRMLDVIKTVPGIKSLFSLRLNSRMVTQMSYYLNYRYRLGQADVRGFHLLNIFIHLLTGILIYWIVFLIAADCPPSGVGGPASCVAGTDKRPDYTERIADSADKDADYAVKSAPHTLYLIPYTSVAPLFTALLFLVHPLCTEPVNYIIARYSLLATMFSFSGLFFFILYFRKRKKIYLFAVMLSLLFSLYAKEIGLIYGLSGMFLYFLIFRSSGDWFGLGKRSIFLVSLFLLLFFLVWRFTPLAGRIAFFGPLEAAKYFLNQNRIFFVYLRLCLFPFSGLNVDHYYPWPGSLWQITNLLSLGLNIVLVTGAVYLRKKDKLLSFAVLWMYLLLLPYFLIPTEEMMVEYRVYPAIFGYVLILSWVIDRLVKEKKFRVITVSLIIAVFSLTTFLRNRIWSSPVDLWLDAVKKSPEKSRAHCNLGNSYGLLGEMNKAIEEFQRAIFLEPYAPQPYLNLAKAYLFKGGYDSAIEISRRALPLKESEIFKADIYLNLADAYTKKGDLEKAKEEYQNVLKFRANSAEAYSNLGTISYQEKNYREAIENLSKAISLDPADPKVYNSLGVVYDLEGKYDLAIAHYRKAVEYNPNFAEAYYNLGISYENKKLPDEATSAYTQAVKVNPHYFRAYNNLGNIYYQKGDFTEAIKQYETAIAFAPDFQEAKNNLGEVKQKMNRLK